VGEAPCFAHFLDDAGNMPDRPDIEIRRVYDADLVRPGEIRVLVDRVWPRGVSRDALQLERWDRELAPSSELRRWFGHDARRWPGFQSRYRYELTEKTALLKELAELSVRRPLVLLYGAKDPAHNQAVVLKEVLEEGIAHSV
jgi:uncharacterized protein YeaO (DUF488 family)